MITKTRILGSLGGNPDDVTLTCDELWTHPTRDPGRPAGYSGLNTVGQVLVIPYPDSPQVLSNMLDLGSESIEYTNRGLHNVCNHTKRQVTVYGDTGLQGWIRMYNQEPWNEEFWRIKATLRNVSRFVGLYAHGIAGRYELGALPAFAGSYVANWENEYSSLALRTMWPGVQTVNLSFLNSFWELKDFSSLLKSAKSIYSRLRKIPQLAKSFGKPLSWKARLNLYKKIATRADLATTMAELHLATEFAVKPFIADVAKLIAAVQGIDAECKRLQSNVGKRLKSHFRTHLPAPHAPTTTTHQVTTPWWLNWYLIERASAYTESEYCATMEYSYELDSYTKNQLKKLVTLDRLGINLNPAILWNAYPWTFVIDWIANIGNFLEQFTIRNVSPIVTIHGFCHSVKTSRTTTLSIEQNPGRIPQHPKLTIAKEDQSIYMRRPFVPNYYSIIQLSGLSRREFILSASLARVRKPKRR